MKKLYALHVLIHVLIDEAHLTNLGHLNPQLK